MANSFPNQEQYILKRRVVVTGLGLITPCGLSVEATWSALLAGRSGVDYIKKFDTERFAVKIGPR